MVLLSEVREPLAKWKTDQVIEWLKTINLEEYLNIVKYEKINGKDILEGDKLFFFNIMGTISDHYQKIKYEINRVKDRKLINQKLYVWGSNSNGQLAIDSQKDFIRKPLLTNINLFEANSGSTSILNSSENSFELKNENDYFVRIYCGNTCSFLQTNHGETYFAGNIMPEIKESTNINIKESKEDKKKKQKKSKNEKNPRSRGNSGITNQDLIDHQSVKTINKWVNVSYLISYDKRSDEFFRAKQIYLNSKNEIVVIGYTSTFVPFIRQDRKAKFKTENNENVDFHVGINSIGSVKHSLTEKFITVQELIEKINKKNLGYELGYSIVYENPMYGILENNVVDFLLTDVPYHKVLQLKFYGDVIYDRKLRYIKHEYK